MSNESLQQQFEEDSPQQVNKLEGIEVYLTMLFGYNL